MRDLASRSAAHVPPLGRALLSGLGPVAAGLGLAALLHLATPSLGGFYTKVLMDVGINIVLAVSLNLVNGFTGQFSIGHAGFMAVGGYVAGSITYYGGFALFGTAMVEPGLFTPGALLFAVATLVGGLAAALAGFVVGLPSLRLRGDYLAIVTLGFGEILRVVVQRSGDVVSAGGDAATAEAVRAMPVTDWFTQVGGSLGFNGLPFHTNLFWVWTAVTAVLLLSARLKSSTHGRALLSIREDEIAAEAMGVPTTRLKVRAFVYAAFFAGIAGSLFAHEVGTTLNPRELGFQKSFEIVIMVVLGGMGSISGTIIAAIVLSVIPELFRSFSEYRMIAYALTLILMMLLRPQGLFGVRELWQLGPFARKGAR
jgi:branched-chain amino acid transport system permease protein